MPIIKIITDLTISILIKMRITRTGMETLLITLISLIINGRVNKTRAINNIWTSNSNSYNKIIKHSSLLKSIRYSFNYR